MDLSALKRASKKFVVKNVIVKKTGLSKLKDAIGCISYK